MRKLFSVAMLAMLVLSGCERDTTYDAFATCLADSDVKFYGAFWCPHCAAQKDLFGDSVDLLPYVECDPNGKDSQTGVCKEEGVESYPTWKFADGTVKTGELSLDELSELSSCPLPGEESVMDGSGDTEIE